MTIVRRSDKGAQGAWAIARLAEQADPHAMGTPDSAIDRDLMAYARGLLAPPAKRERVWPVLGAAALLAAASMIFAVAMITAPPLHTEHVAREAVE